MEPRKKKSNSKKTLPEYAKTSLLNRIALFVVTLAGTIASIVLFILFRRKRTKSPSTPEDAEPEHGSNIEQQPSVEDDDPHIFNLRTFGYFAVFMVGLIGFVVLVGALLSGFYLPGRSIVVTPAATLLPPAPRLESSSAQEFPSLHATQEAELNSYGWINRQKGVVHIPIERAMELIAKNNLPVVSGTPVASTPLAP
jgi:hypothetical protein